MGSYHLYDSEEWKQVRSFVYERDNYTCFWCGYNRDEGDLRINAHHLLPLYYCEGTWLETSPINLVTVCEKTHAAIHEEQWTNPHTGEEKNFYSPWNDHLPPRWWRFAAAYFFIKWHWPDHHGEGEPQEEVV